MINLRVRVLLGIALAGLFISHGSLWAGASETSPPAWTFVLDRSFEAREAACPWRKPLETASLVFPLPRATNILPAPVKAEAGQPPLPHYPDPDLVVWQVEPWREAHAEYLKRSAEASDRGGRLQLVAWCEQQKLSLCAEFELRRMLAEFKTFMDPGYRPLLDRWLPHADQRQSNYCFPLPLEGEWFVVPDRTGHHRIKAGAAYAFDLVIQKNGRLFAGSGARNEDYFSWGQPIVAQADGVVRQALDHQPDAAPGQSGGFDNANYVSVDYGAGISGFYAHLMKGSLTVKVGDTVKPGQALAKVGNSGASGMPHLHFTFTDASVFSLKGRFRAEVLRAGRWVLADGENLTEGTTVRNPAGVWDAAETKK